MQRAIIALLLEPLISSFCKGSPEVEAELAASKDLVDLATERFDAGNRLGQSLAADMAAA